MEIREIKVEYLKEPLGVDTPVPGFSWKLDSSLKNTIQTYYRIQVSDTKKIFWDSEIVETDKSVCILYEGESLCPKYLFCI